MISAWTKHLETEAEKQQYRESLLRVQWVLTDLKKLINSSTEALEVSEMSPKSYDNPNWPYRQAHANGYKQALKDFSKLLNLDPKEPNGRQPVNG